MSATDPLERDLTAWFGETAMPRTPDYTDDILRQTARSRQRPRWTFPERWLSMSVLTMGRHALRPVPWRAIGMLAILVVLLIAALTFVAGSQRRIPSPFGRAANGLVAYAKRGDIYTVDPATGRSTAIVTGPETDLNPRFSRDGTRLVFERETQFGASTADMYVVRPDGSGLTRVTPQPLRTIASSDFSPDGSMLLISTQAGGVDRLVIAATDGSGMRLLDLGGSATNAAWVPPSGSEILYTDAGTDDSDFGGLHLVNAQGGPVRTILASAAAAERFRGHPMVSPDGSMISFGEWTNADTVDVQTHIINGDGSHDRTLPLPPGAVWQAPYGWSNDGTRLLVIRGYSGGNEQARPAAIPVDGSGFGTEIPYPGGMDTGPTTNWEWAPDDSTILGTPFTASGSLLDQVLLDPVHGTLTTLPWSTLSQPTWQRRAP